MSMIARRANATVPDGEHVVLRGVRYRHYVALREEPANRHLRMAYHDGILEIMSPEFVHERPTSRIAMLIWTVCMEFKVEYEATRSTTMRRGTDRLKKGHGKEPDESFYFANLRKILGKEKIDLDVDPPPDLWVEVDNRASSKGKLPTYAALGVPEVWRLRAKSRRLWFGRLLADGSGYEEIGRSLSLPMLTPALVLEAMEIEAGASTGAWSIALQAWVRERLAGAEGRRE